MNNQLQAQITQILSAIMTSVGEAKDFSVSQLPEIAQQYITYGIWSTSASVILCLLIIIGALISLNCSIDFLKDANTDDEMFFGSVMTSFSIVAGGVSALNLVSKSNDLILILTAPKVWFILQLKELIS